MEFIQHYNVTIMVIGLIGFAMLIQLLVADVAVIKYKHTPGFPVEADHGNFLFRSSRAFANTNESIAIFITFALFAMLSQASAQWLNVSALIYAAGRLGHMMFYYSNSKICRSIAFAVSVSGLVSMLLAGLKAHFA